MGKETLQRQSLCGLWFQRIRVHDGGVEARVSTHGGWSRSWVMNHLYLESRENYLEMSQYQVFTPSKLPTVVSFHLRGHIYTNPNSTTNWTMYSNCLRVLGTFLLKLQPCINLHNFWLSVSAFSTYGHLHTILLLFFWSLLILYVF